MWRSSLIPDLDSAVLRGRLSIVWLLCLSVVAGGCTSGSPEEADEAFAYANALLSRQQLERAQAALGACVVEQNQGGKCDETTLLDSLRAAIDERERAEVELSTFDQIR